MIKMMKTEPHSFVLPLRLLCHFTSMDMDKQFKHFFLRTPQVCSNIAIQHRY